MPGSKFCDECGLSLSVAKGLPGIDFNRPDSYTPRHLAEKIFTTRSYMEGEHKLVTVLFADIAGSTSMFENLDPEDVHEIMDGYFRILMDEVHRYEGTINQFRGDGVMALFGAPIAHEDHARRACHASLAILNAISPYAGNLERDYGIGLKTRIGLNTGPVVVGSIGDDLRMDYTAQGDTSNLASRMESHADPGTVLISANTHRLVRDFFEFETKGKIQVKGKEKPIQAYQLLRSGEIETRIKASEAKGLARFVGRRRELESLKEAFDKVEAGQGQVVGVVGEAGVGKSRLLLEMQNALPKAGADYFEGQCLRYGGAMPFQPLLDILKSYVGVKEGDSDPVAENKLKIKILDLDENLRAVIPPLQALLSLKKEDEERGSLEPKQKKEMTFEAIRNLLIRASLEKPMILAIEDLHWIDNTSQDFLDYMIGWIPNAHILLILLYRPVYTHAWGSKSYYRKIGVDQLPPDASAELVKAILEGEEVLPEIKELILNRTSGNPLFVEELTHSLLESGSIRKQEGRYVLEASPMDKHIPDTIQGIVAARIDRLDEASKHIMQVASVIGREFSFHILQTVMENKQGLKSHLFSLQGLEFIHEKNTFPALEYVFKHAITQEVAYNGLLHRNRREIHGKIGKATEQIFSERLEEFHEMLAYHYSRSDNLKKAVYYLKLAGHKAMRRFSPAEAFRFYKEAISILNRMEGTDQNKQERIEILVSMALPMRELAYPEDSFEYLQEGETLCKEADHQRSLTILYSHLGSFYSAKGNASMGMKYILDAFEGAEQLQDSQIAARIGASLSFSLDVAGEYRKVVRLTPRILALVEKTGMQAALLGMPFNLHSLLYANYGHGLGYLGEFTEGQQACEKAQSLAQETDNAFSIALVEFLYGCFFLPKGDGESSASHMEISIGHLEKLGAVFYLPLALSLLGEGYRLAGELHKALGCMEKGLELLVRTGMPVWLSLYHYHLSLAHFDLGNLKAAKSHAEQGVYFGQENGEQYGKGQSLLQLGKILSKTNSLDTKDAEKHVLQGLKILDELETKPAYAVGCLDFGEIYLDKGLKEDALININKAERMFQAMGMNYWLEKSRMLTAKINKE